MTIKLLIFKDSMIIPALLFVSSLLFFNPLEGRGEDRNSAKGKKVMQEWFRLNNTNHTLKKVIFVIPAVTVLSYCLGKKSSKNQNRKA